MSLQSVSSQFSYFPISQENESLPGMVPTTKPQEDASLSSRIHSYRASSTPINLPLPSTIIMPQSFNLTFSSPSSVVHQPPAYPASSSSELSKTFPSPNSNLPSSSHSLPPPYSTAPLSSTAASVPSSTTASSSSSSTVASSSTSVSSKPLTTNSVVCLKLPLSDFPNLTSFPISSSNLTVIFFIHNIPIFWHNNFSIF